MKSQAAATRLGAVGHTSGKVENTKPARANLPNFSMIAPLSLRNAALALGCRHDPAPEWSRAMIRKLVIIPMLFLVATAATAQAGRRPPPPPPPFSEIAGSLDLTAKQRPRVEAILAERRTNMDALHDVSRQEHRRIDEIAHAQLASVLSADQMQRLRAWEQAHRPPPPPAESDDPTATHPEQDPPPGAKP